jgi:hypothetical protein
MFETVERQLYMTLKELLRLKVHYDKLGFKTCLCDASSSMECPVHMVGHIEATKRYPGTYTSAGSNTNDKRRGVKK